MTTNRWQDDKAKGSPSPSQWPCKKYTLMPYFNDFNTILRFRHFSHYRVPIVIGAALDISEYVELPAVINNNIDKQNNTVNYTFSLFEIFADLCFSTFWYSQCLG